MRAELTISWNRSTIYYQLINYLPLPFFNCIFLQCIDHILWKHRGKRIQHKKQCNKSKYRAIKNEINNQTTFLLISAVFRAFSNNFVWHVFWFVIFFICRYPCLLFDCGLDAISKQSSDSILLYYETERLIVWRTTRLRSCLIIHKSLRQVMKWFYIVNFIQIVIRTQPYCQYLPLFSLLLPGRCRISFWWKVNFITLFVSKITHLQIQMFGQSIDKTSLQTL